MQGEGAAGQIVPACVSAGCVGSEGRQVGVPLQSPRSPAGCVLSGVWRALTLQPGTLSWLRLPGWDWPRLVQGSPLASWSALGRDRGADHSPQLPFICFK